MVLGGLTWWMILLLTLAMALLWTRSRSLRRQTGLPDGNLIYSDAGTWFSNEEVFYSPELHVVGKPDYLIEEEGGSIIPVELKSGRAPDTPREGHVLQLAAYCLLVHEHYGTRPEYGILQYKDKAFAIDFTAELEEDLLDLLAEMREGMFSDEVDRDHNDWARCAGCSMRAHCYQRLG